VEKRYRDFLSIEKHLSTSKWKESLTQQLPPKKWFGKLSGAVVARRQRALELFVQVLLEQINPYDCFLLAEFIELPLEVGGTFSYRADTSQQGDSGTSCKEKGLDDEFDSNADGIPDLEAMMHAIAEQHQHEIEQMQSELQQQVHEQLQGPMDRIKMLEDENRELLNDLMSAESREEDLQEELNKTKGELQELITATGWDINGDGERS
jgi:hypothetical protein